MGLAAMISVTRMDKSYFEKVADSFSAVFAMVTLLALVLAPIYLLRAI